MSTENCSTKKKETMQWSDEKDVLMMREVAAIGVFTHKSGSRERGNSWQVVATNLNSIDGFLVTGRAVRDRITSLMKKFSAQNNTEKKASGISGDEPTEAEILLQDLLDMCADSELRKGEEKLSKITNTALEKQKAVDIRNIAMESMKETRKRKCEDESKEKRTRRSSNDTLEFLKEKMDMDRELKKKELENKEKEQQTFQQMMLQQQQNSDNMIQLFAAQAQSQSDQLRALMTQQQNQMLALIQALKKD